MGTQEPGINSTADAYQRALSRLPGVLTRLSPRHGATRVDCEVEDDAPSRVRDLWPVLGWSSVTALGRPEPPTREAGVRLLERVFEQWFEDAPTRDRWRVNPGESLPSAMLPRRFRVVSTSDSDLLITDESQETDDPVVIRMARDKPEVQLYHRSYVEWELFSIFRNAAARRCSSCVPLHPAPEGAAILSPLLPHLYAVGEGVWRLDEPRADVTRPVVYGDRVLYDSLSNLVTATLSIPAESLGLFWQPVGHRFEVGLTPRLDPHKVKEPSLRGFPRREHDGRPNEQVWFATGFVEAVPVWIEHDRIIRSRRLRIWVHPGDRDRFRDWIVASKVKIHGELRPDGTPGSGDYDWSDE